MTHVFSRNDPPMAKKSRKLNIGKLPRLEMFNMTELDPKQRKLVIPSRIFDQMRQLVKICNLEVSALGLLSFDKDALRLQELFIPSQNVGATHAQINGGMISEIQSELFREKRIVPGDTSKFLRFAWHSHVNAPARMSIPDRETFTALGGKSTSLDPEWFISMVMNRANDYQIILDLFRPVRLVIDITDKMVIEEDRNLVQKLFSKVKRGKQTVIGNKAIKVIK